MENEERNKRDVLTIDDVALEIRVPLILRRKRKALQEKLAINKPLMNADLVHALNGYPKHLALPEVIAA
jgi:hypothetical protein